MAINDSAVVKIATAHFYTAPTGTAAPAGGIVEGVEWEEVGHTTLEDILSMSTEGGEKTVLGTLQNRNLRTSYSAKSTAFNFSVHQFDEEGLKLFYGANSIVDSDGRIGPADTPQPTETAFYVLIEDGDSFFDFYCEKSEILGAEDMALADTESLASLPLAVTPLSASAGKAPFLVGPVKKKDEADELGA